MSLNEQREVKKARAMVRAKEGAAWDRVEQAGRTARQAESAQGQKAGAKANTDEDDAKKRQGMTQ